MTHRLESAGTVYALIFMGQSIRKSLLGRVICDSFANGHQVIYIGIICNVFKYWEYKVRNVHKSILSQMPTASQKCLHENKALRKLHLGLRSRSLKQIG